MRWALRRLFGFRAECVLLHSVTLACRCDLMAERGSHISNPALGSFIKHVLARFDDHMHDIWGRARTRR
jgi:hypothetical protein